LSAWTAGTTLLIGGLWPLVLRRLTGPLPIPERPAPVMAIPSSAPAANLAADDDLLELVHNLEADLPPAVESCAAKNVATPPAPLRTLSAAPLETAVAAPQQEDEKDYRGEYYPTVVHAKSPPAAS
ncbi:MAG: hypothetical protein JWL69_4116, partial [Phycisphaerales bacterium]|nr:hypothetical protein [Phycisphaerales bacterium]